MLPPSAVTTTSGVFPLALNIDDIGLSKRAVQDADGAAQLFHAGNIVRSLHADKCRPPSAGLERPAMFRSGLGYEAGVNALREVLPWVGAFGA